MQLLLLVTVAIGSVGAFEVLNVNEKREYTMAPFKFYGFHIPAEQLKPEKLYNAWLWVSGEEAAETSITWDDDRSRVMSSRRWRVKDSARLEFRTDSAGVPIGVPNEAIVEEDGRRYYKVLFYIMKNAPVPYKNLLHEPYEVVLEVRTHYFGFVGNEEMFQLLLGVALTVVFFWFSPCTLR
eukprot:TRINITY_DN6893_c0_g2_i4.p1 TRINITY_DN6893_c0_g2~~TRINITY_DN6893_c0_g2_i4.p1  ORF type:complete len:181 (-),score=29.98 TRINITY_DN6893_c0_g2_i4:86-628(-)